MSRFYKVIGCLATAAMLFFCSSCEKNNRDIPTPKEGTETPGEDPGQVDIDFTIATCTNKIVAHRGGSSECGAPDNSRASLRYAMQLKCYGSECDIYWTKDNNVVIGHADAECKINGYHPWEATLEQIRKA
ncbi:MAG: glycerophosphodiester phosphodiesterase, partial [Bacteroidales bacterium]|nr:glycerophosphodiester phosphodiesterase [Bacteroidales bacterium]